LSLENPRRICSKQEEENEEVLKKFEEDKKKDSERVWKPVP
jgi:hypothetical protein